MSQSSYYILTALQNQTDEALCPIHPSNQRSRSTGARSDIQSCARRACRSHIFRGKRIERPKGSLDCSCLGGNQAEIRRIPKPAISMSAIANLMGASAPTLDHLIGTLGPTLPSSTEYCLTLFRTRSAVCGCSSHETDRRIAEPGGLSVRFRRKQGRGLPGAPRLAGAMRARHGDRRRSSAVATASRAFPNLFATGRVAPRSRIFLLAKACAPPAAPRRSPAAPR